MVRFSAGNSRAVTSTVADLNVLPVEPALSLPTITVFAGSTAAPRRKIPGFLTTSRSRYVPGPIEMTAPVAGATLMARWME